MEAKTKWPERERNRILTFKHLRGYVCHVHLEFCRKCTRNIFVVTDACSLVLLSTSNIYFLLNWPTGLENCTEPCLIYTVSNRIDAIELASSRVVNLVSNLTLPLDLDVHVSERTLYWSDSNQRVIKRMNMSSGVMKDIITEDHGYVGDLAVEWESRLLYWTDSFYHRIEVASLDGTKRKVLFSESLSYPAGIAVHPKKGWVESVKWSHLFEAS